MTGAFDPVTVLRILTEEGVSFVVIGGIAARVHGSVRVTDDLDVVPEPGIENARRLERALALMNARFRGVDAHLLGVELDAATLAEGANFMLATDFGDLDVMPIVEGGIEWSDLRGRASVHALGEVQVPVAGRDDLIAMKRAAGRRQDIEDIVQITEGMHMAANQRAAVLIRGRTRAPDDQAVEAADIATLAWEEHVRSEAVGGELVIRAELEGFAESHARVWASGVTRKLQEVLDGEPVIEITTPPRSSAPRG